MRDRALAAAALRNAAPYLRLYQGRVFVIKVGGEAFESDSHPLLEQVAILHRLGIRWFCLLLRLVSGLRVTDPTSGFWAANRRAAELLLADYSSDYPEVDSLVHLSQSGCTVEEVAVAMRPRVAGRSSIKGARMLYYMIKVTIARLVGRLRPSRSRES